MMLHPRQLSTDRFTWVAAEGAFVAEASDLGGFPLDRIWDDAADAGFALVSAKTGSRIIFGLVGEARDGEGELKWLDYQPVDTRETRVRRVTIFND